MKNKHTYLIAISLLVIAAVAIGVSTQQEESIRIGFIGPLTGDVALYGIAEQNAIEIAINEINQEGGINGKQIQVIYEDTRCSASEAANAAHKLISSDGAKVILGGLCSSETLAIAPVANTNEVIVFSSASTSPDISHAGEFIFRNAPSDAQSARATAKLTEDNGHQQVAILYENTDYAATWAETFKESYTGSIVADMSYPESTQDYNTLVTKTLNANPQAIVFSPQGEDGVEFVEQLRAQGYTGPLYSNVILSGEEIIKEYSEVLEGMYVSDVQALDVRNPEASAFLDSYEEYTGKQPPLARYAAARYDSVHLIADAIDQTSYDGLRIRDYLHTTSYEGALGRYGFDTNGDMTDISYENKQVRNGSLVVLGTALI